jgi:hypothetical protein
LTTTAIPPTCIRVGENKDNRPKIMNEPVPAGFEEEVPPIFTHGQDCFLIYLTPLSMEKSTSFPSEAKTSFKPTSHPKTLSPFGWNLKETAVNVLCHNDRPCWLVRTSPSIYRWSGCPTRTPSRATFRRAVFYAVNLNY